jgi:sRNA-binding carbon storage regulator CsrA
MRYEIYEEIRKNNQAAADSSVAKMKAKLLVKN